MQKLSSIVFAAVLGAACSWARADQTIVLVRHGEKPAAGLGQLSCQGLNRSLALPRVLLSRFGKPAAIFAPNPALRKTDGAADFDYVRPLATIEPTAIAAGLPVHVEIGFTDTAALVSALLAPEYTHATIFVAWEHRQLVIAAKALVQSLGGNPASVPAWSGKDFDGIYVIRIHPGADGKRVVTFEVEQQGLNGQAMQCPGPQS